MKQSWGLITLLTFTSFTAHALPILSASSDNYGRLATITPDHEDPRQRYFFPNMGGVQKNRNGVPRFGLSYWDEPTSGGGGFMSGVFKLSIDDELRAAIDDSMKRGLKVSVLPVQRSFIRFMQDENGERVFNNLFSEIDLPPYSGRAEDSIGLSASLTTIGGKVLAQQILSAGFGSELEYCYTIKGVSPVFDAKIELNYDKIYRHFLAQARGGRWWWKWSIRTEVEKLIENQDIKIQINGGDATKYDYIMALVDRFSERFFIPALENRRGSVPGRMGVSYTVIEEHRTKTFQLTQREIIERDYCVSLGIDELKDFPELIVKIQ